MKMKMIFTNKEYLRKFKAGILLLRKIKRMIIVFALPGFIVENGFYLIDVWRGRVEFPELKRKVVELAKLHSV